uniref:Uncharacterized protein n=1 Tax=Arundo donax TaxID=35708 RepID=A0A0A9DET4_ARUDO
MNVITEKHLFESQTFFLEIDAYYGRQYGRTVAVHINLSCLQDTNFLGSEKGMLTQRWNAGGWHQNYILCNLIVRKPNIRCPWKLNLGEGKENCDGRDVEAAGKGLHHKQKVNQCEMCWFYQ